MIQTTRIWVERGETTRISKLFGTTRQTVRQALKYATSTELAERIREDALKAGGIIVKKKMRK